MKNIPQIKPAALAYIKVHGQQTAQALAPAIQFDRFAIAKVLRQLAVLGDLEIVEKEKVGQGSRRLHYDLPRKREWPHMGAGEYIGLHHTGFHPEMVRRLAT